VAGAPAAGNGSLMPMAAKPVIGTEDQYVGVPGAGGRR